MAGIRQDMVNSAVTFLRDPSIAASPLGKRIAFLEVKGLTPAEIEEAMRLSSAPSGPSYRGHYNSMSNQQQGRDWRDWFIMAVIGSGVGYLATALVRKYLLPALQPPTTTQLTDAQKALEAKYDEAAALLEQLKKDTESVAASLEDQTEKVDASLKQVIEAVQAFKDSDERRNEEIRACKEEIDTLKDSLPKMIEKTKEAQTASLTDLQQELKSLKSLLLSRRNDGNETQSKEWTSSTGKFGGSFLPGANRPPGIPAWQLASASNGPSSASDSTSSTPAVEDGAAKPTEGSSAVEIPSTSS